MATHKEKISDFLRLRETHHLPSLSSGSASKGTLSSEFWGVQFYPYTEPGIDPVFAAVGNQHILVCRPEGGESKSFEVIKAIVGDNDPDSDYFTCAWSKDLESGAPLLCVAGSNANIQVYDVVTGDLKMTLPGHGAAILDLKVSPVNPQILASASQDSTVRMWSLDPAHKKEPCFAIFAGDGHREIVESISFHSNGQYLLSGGTDRIINLWIIPDFPDANNGILTTVRIHYPHFSTSEVHDHGVDCVEFYGDLIFSKSANEDLIVLWSITGFSSSNPPLPISAAPTGYDPQKDTRSAFCSTQWHPIHASPRLFTRIVQFSIPDCEILFTRFGLFPGSSNTSPTLAMTNCKSKTFFWDLNRLERYQEYISAHLYSSNSKHDSSAEIPRPPFLASHRPRQRDIIRKETTSHGKQPHSHLRTRHDSPNDPHSSHSSMPTSTVDEATNLVKPTHPSSLASQQGEETLPPPTGPDMDFEKSKETWDKRYDMSYPWASIAAHRDEVIRGLNFVGRQIAWSVGGEWCVVVGSMNTIAVFERKGGAEKEDEHERDTSNK